MFAQLEDEPAQLPLGTAFPTVTVCTYRFGGEVNLRGTLERQGKPEAPRASGCW